MRNKKVKGTMKLEQLKYLSMKIQKVTSNVAIVEENEKGHGQIIQLSRAGTKENFQIKLLLIFFY